MRGCRDYVTSKTGDAFLRGYCLGLVEGVAKNATNICPPHAASNEQAVRVVVQYIDSQPARLHEDFGDLAVKALRQSWPCQVR
jgi:Rap1a immunity proteins